MVFSPAYFEPSVQILQVGGADAGQPPVARVRRLEHDRDQPGALHLCIHEMLVIFKACMADIYLHIRCARMADYCWYAEGVR